MWIFLIYSVGHNSHDIPSLEGGSTWPMLPGIEYILPLVWIYFSLSLSKPNSSNVVKYDSLQIYNLTHLAKLLRCHQSSSSKTRTHTRRKTRSIPLGLSLNLHMVVPSCLCLSQQPGQSKCLTKQLAFRNCKRHMKRGCIRRPQILPCGNEEALGSRVFVLSDLHTDYSENMTWVKGLSTVRHKKDVLLVAGDVAETHKNFVLTMSLLKDRFEQVFYVPGNHDLWCRCEEDDYLDSLEKLKKLLDACRGLGVLSNPMIIDGLGIIPLFSWYHESFDREKDITGIRIRSLEMACKDFHACKWPGELSNHDTSLALYFDAMNDKNEDMIKEIQKKCSKIISFSHFLPRQELCPEKRMLFYPNLPKIIGSDWLEARIRSIHRIEGSASACHVFGHTHFCWDAVLDGIRYVQAPLAYPRERKRRMNGGEDWLPFCIYSDGKFADRLSPCYWSDYYSANPRAPHITQLAPWVARFYGRPSSHAPH